jgi:hypothetical protein
MPLRAVMKKGCAPAVRLVAGSELIDKDGPDLRPDNLLVFTRLTSELPLHHKDDERDHCHGEHRRSNEYRDRHHGTPELSSESLPQLEFSSFNSALCEIAAMLARRRAPCSTGVAGMCLILCTT